MMTDDRSNKRVKRVLMQLYHTNVITLDLSSSVIVGEAAAFGTPPFLPLT